MLKEVWDVVQGAEAWPGVTVAPDRNGLRLSLGGAILGHLRWNGRIDLPFRAKYGSTRGRGIGQSRSRSP